MRTRPRRSNVASGLALALIAVAGARCRSVEPTDVLAGEVGRWSELVANETSTSDDWKQVKASCDPALAIARDALGRGERLAALYRLELARPSLEGCAFELEQAPALGDDLAGFEKLWSDVGRELGTTVEAPSASSLASRRPAAVRALAEAARLQIGVNYRASLDYGRAEGVNAGLFYLGVARSQRAFVERSASLREARAGELPRLRSLAPELDALGRDMLLAYRPPLSIERHSEFIVAHAALNEARELDRAGLRFGALLRYLQAGLRFARLRADVALPEGEELARRIDEFSARLASDPRDHTIARMLLEVARVEMASAESGAPTPAASAVAGDALPRYFAALEASPRVAGAKPARVRVTLVRWPYT